MNIEYFEYIMYEAFNCLLIYDNKDTITFEQLHNYKDFLVKHIYDYYNDYRKDFEDDIMGWDEALKFVKDNNNLNLDDERKILEEIIKKNDNLFSIYDDRITIAKDYLTELGGISNLEKNLGEIPKSIYLAVISSSTSLEGVKLLDSNSKSHQIESILESERKLEELYMSANGIEEINLINIYRVINTLQWMEMSKKSYDKLTYYGFLLSSSINPTYDYSSIDVIDPDLLVDNNFFRKNDYIEVFLENVYQTAIFSNKSLYSLKAEYYLDNLLNLKFYELPNDDIIDPLMDEYYFEDHYDDYVGEDEIDEDLSFVTDVNDKENDFIKEMKLDQSEAFIFYLKYINTILQYQDKYNDPEMENTKNRLIYLLDNNYRLYDDHSLKQVIEIVSNKVKNYDFDFDNYYIMSRLMLSDLIHTDREGNNVLKKALFVRTYHDLTKDKKIEDIALKKVNIPLDAFLDQVISEYQNENKHKQFNKKNSPNKNAVQE